MPQKRSSLGSVEDIGEGKWRVWVSAGRDARTGKRMRRSKVVRGTRRDAENERVRMLAEAGSMPERATEMTYGEYLEGIYLPDAEKRLEPDTVYSYRSAARAVLPVIGGVLLDALRPSHIDSLMSSIGSPGARLKAYKLVRQSLRRAKRMRLVSDVATDAVDPPKVPEYHAETIDAHQAARLLAAFRGHEIEPAVLLALGCGLRRSEICALDWDDVDLAANEVHVTKKLVVVEGEQRVGPPKTSNSWRVVSLPESFAVRLREIRPDGPQLPLLSVSGARMNPDTVTGKYGERCDEAGCHWVSLKNLRHSHATIMLASGVNVVDVSRRLGHSSVSITDRFYLRPKRAADQRAAIVFDEAFGAL